MEGKLIIVIDKDAPARVALCKIVRETGKQYHIEILKPDNFWLVPTAICGDADRGFYINKNKVTAVDVTEQDYEDHRVV